MVKERLTEIEDISIETSKTEKQRGRRLKKQNQIPGTVDNYKMCDICVMGLPEGKEMEKRKEEIFATVKTKNFPQINARHYI